jgi:nanoRNase/pAp phosphatase (c-di-AMP/oligoRNAs hydrolase)
MLAMTRSARKLADLRNVLAGKAAMLIGLQDNPDPDAFGAAAALRKLANDLAGVHCSLACGGTVGRSENRAMVR